jgi:hypothetical protein
MNIPSGKLFLFIDLLPFFTAVFRKLFIGTIQCSNNLLVGLFKSFIQRCFICSHSDSTVSEDAGIEPRIVATIK